MSQTDRTMRRQTEGDGMRSQETEIINALSACYHFNVSSESHIGKSKSDRISREDYAALLRLTSAEIEALRQTSAGLSKRCVKLLSASPRRIRRQRVMDGKAKPVS
jgi:elongation factor P hydroxylase